jgi:hypothetical protein
MPDYHLPLFFQLEKTLCNIACLLMYLGRIAKFIKSYFDFYAFTHATVLQNARSRLVMGKWSSFKFQIFFFIR